MTMSDRLREARRLSGLSARALSRCAGLAETHVSLIESGATNMGTQTAERLANALGVSLDWLVSGVGNGPTEVSVRAAVAAAGASSADESGAHVAHGVKASG